VAWSSCQQVQRRLIFYGPNRHGDNLFANSLLCLDATTGKRRWHFQVVKHDVWDRDLPAAPALVKIRRGGRVVEAVHKSRKLATSSSWSARPESRSSDRIPQGACQRHRRREITGDAADPLKLSPSPGKSSRKRCSPGGPRSASEVLERFVKYAATASLNHEPGRNDCLPGFDGGPGWEGCIRSRDGLITSTRAKSPACCGSSSAEAGGAFQWERSHGRHCASLSRHGFAR